MAKGYIVTTYRAIHDTEKLAAYAKLAGPAVQVRGNPVKTFEAGLTFARLSSNSTAPPTLKLPSRARPTKKRSGPSTRGLSATLVLSKACEDRSCDAPFSARRKLPRGARVE